MSREMVRMVGGSGSTQLTIQGELAFSVASPASIRRHVIAGMTATVLLLGGVGGWAAAVNISGAVIAPGVISVASHDKNVQHPTGGVIASLEVREGEHVVGGQILMRLDDTITRANLAVITKRLDQLQARQIRLQTELEGGGVLRFPAELIERTTEPEINSLLKAETNLFSSRREMRDGLKAQLKERILQYEKEIDGLQQQVDAKGDQIAAIEREIKGARQLLQKGLMRIGEVTQLEQDLAVSDGLRGQLIAQIAATRGKIAETMLQVAQVDAEMRNEAAKELREIENERGEDIEKKIAAQDDLMRVNIRSPQAGSVHELSIHTIGGVIAPGEILAKIVPDNEELTVDARVSPNDVDQIYTGQLARLRLLSYNQSTTPVFDGVVVERSPDTSVDERTGHSFYVVRIKLNDKRIEKRLNTPLLPGMPVTAYLKTDDRTALSYVIRPLTDRVADGFRE